MKKLRKDEKRLAFLLALLQKQSGATPEEIQGSFVARSRRLARATQLQRQAVGAAVAIAGIGTSGVLDPQLQPSVSGVSGAVEDIPSVPPVPAAGAGVAGLTLYRRIPGNTPSSPCQQCAPWIGMIHRKDGSVPLIPLHLRCVCRDVPLTTILGSDDAAIAKLGKRRFGWLKSLSRKRLEQVIGAVRARLYRSGDLQFEQMWTSGGEMVSLEELGFDRNGNPSS